ncbi:DUF2461 domain-containing protein [Flavobacterium sp. SM15]|uniref:DUF2461 domain-containing protein n=1 Tax=Flavobacterium sp. SM15 TaxID=2908005 RepID=UPI001EDA3949|nr:DUF2461 domain-containing protein [Flavobacterium sp. SM15]MCG2611683.1 DUF2461 domain-containing protein [Flavobacterium sp. SM15]
MVSKATLDFLIQLRNNNNREWFADNKKEFQKLEKDFKASAQELVTELSKSDSIDKIQMFRIYRDVRFSKDKSPYKTNFGVALGRTKPMLRGGYYLHIEPGGSFVGGGFWEPNAEDLNRIRKEFEMDDTEIRKIISDKNFVKIFGTLQGDELKTAPKGFDKEHPAIDLIRKKQYLISRKFTDKEVMDKNFKEEVLNTFLAMRPFFDYMSEVLGTNLNGESIY